MSATLAPDRSFDRSLDQRMAALAKGNEVRSRRAQLKRDLHDGRQLVVPLLACPPDFIGTMRVAELLLAVPRLGGVKVTKLLRTVNVSPSRRLGSLSERQRLVIARLVAPRDVATVRKSRAGGAW